MAKIVRNRITSLTHWKNSINRKPLILLGARQVGKSFLLQEFGLSEFKATHIFDFEADSKLAAIFEADLDPERILRDLSLYTGRTIHVGEDLVIFDEIQSCGRALTSLKYFCEKCSSLHLACAGSLLGILLSKSSFPVGKVTFMNLAPLTFSEFIRARGEDLLVEEIHTCFAESRQLSIAAHIRLLECMRYFTLIGGLPGVVASCATKKSLTLQDTLSIRDLQKELITTYLADMAKHCGKVNAMHIERIWRSIPEQLARGIDGNSNKYTFKDVVPGIRGYERLASALDWLFKARIIIKVPIIEHAIIPLRAYAHENIFKLFMFDIGLLTAMTQIDPFILLSNELSTFKGYLFENFVAQELQAEIPDQFYCWRSKESEIDFLIQEGDNVLPIEVKAGHNTKSRSLSVFCKRYAPKRTAMLSANNLETHESEKLRYPLYLASQIFSSS